MRANEWKRFVRPLMPADESWQFRGRLCYRAPVRRFLFGVLAESSAFDSGVYIWQIVMPLFVPSEDLNLSWSDRVGGGSTKYYLDDGQALTAAVLSCFQTHPDEVCELRRLSSLNGLQARNIRLVEAAAYSQILLGDGATAAQLLKLADNWVPSYSWVQEVMDRMTGFGDVLARQGVAEAARLLDVQAEHTAAALGVVH